MPQIGVTKVGISQVGISQISIFQASTSQIGISQVNTAQVNFFISMLFSPFIPHFYPLFENVKMLWICHRPLLSIYANHATTAAMPVDTSHRPSTAESLRCCFCSHKVDPLYA